MSLPRFEKNFRERTQEGWAAFSQIEAELRQIIDTDETHQRGEELVEKCGNALKTVPTLGLAASSCPITEPRPFTRLNTPLGNPTSSTICAKTYAFSGGFD